MKTGKHLLAALVYGAAIFGASRLAVHVDRGFDSWSLATHVAIAGAIGYFVGGIGRRRCVLPTERKRVSRDPQPVVGAPRRPEPKIAVSLTYDQWVHVGAAITHALELDCRLPADRQHPLVEFWAEMLRELERQIEAEPPDHAGLESRP